MEAPFVPPLPADEEVTTEGGAAKPTDPSSPRNPISDSHYLKSTMASRVQQATTSIASHLPTNGGAKREASGAGEVMSVSALCAADPYTGDNDIFEEF